MTVAINSVVINGGPLPEGDLCAYSYDPTTSSVYLTRLLDEPLPTTTQTKAFVGAVGPVSFTGQLYPGIIKLKFTSTFNGKVGTISLKNSINQVIFNTDLNGDNNFDNTLLVINTFGYKINDFDTYTLTIANDGLVGSNIQLVSLELPTGASTYTVYSGAFDQTPALTGIGALTDFTATISNYMPLNTTWGYVRKNGRHLAVQTLAPFPPPFYDSSWFNPLDYLETTNYVRDYINYKAQPFFTSETFTSTPDLSKVVKIIDDIHARLIPTCYSLALITQEDSGHQLMWRCIKDTRVYNAGAPTNFTSNYNVNRWIPSEKVYKYKAGGIFFGGKDYSGPLSSILIDSQDGVTYSEAKILDLNEFPVNSNNELYVHAYVCNYNPNSPKIYCVLNKQTGRMAEIDPVAKIVKYFTIVVPLDSQICQLYYTNRLMYTVLNTVNNAFSLYDANNNGVLLYAFDVGTYNPAVIPQFTIIN